MRVCRFRADRFDKGVGGITDAVRNYYEGGAVWAATILGPASFVVGGVLNLTQSHEVVATLRHLGYPAYAGFVFDLSAAAVSRAAVGDGLVDVLAPLGFLALVLAPWALRPASRTLPSRPATTLFADFAPA